MMRNKVYLILTIVIAFFSSCIKTANLDYRKPVPALVVDGTLLTDSTPCTITLSYSGLFNSSGAQQQNFIDDATVYVKDDLGDSSKLYPIGSGQYQSAGSINAVAGRSYSLSIVLSNGKRYASVPEKIAPVTKSLQLDSIGSTASYAYDDLYGAQIKIRTQDPADQVNYYRWTSVDWLSREATGIPCGANPCFVYCYQFYHDPGIYILPDKFVNGSEIRYQLALTSPYFTVGRHYIEIKQLSLTQRAFQFWDLYQQQQTRTGGILDPLPSPIQGNIYNVDDPTELALGYFEASDVASLKLIFAPIYINSYFTFRNRANHIETGACYLIYPNALNDPPPGWEGAPEYITNVY